MTLVCAKPLRRVLQGLRRIAFQTPHLVGQAPCVSLGVCVCSLACGRVGKQDGRGPPGERQRVCVI